MEYLLQFQLHPILIDLASKVVNQGKDYPGYEHLILKLQSNLVPYDLVTSGPTLAIIHQLGLNYLDALWL